jgi:hypothetical protein
MQKIKSFADACKALKIKTNLPDVSELAPKDRKSIIAHYKLTIIARALNAGWKPDWTNWNQYKYYPWFEYKKTKSGFGFSYSHYGSWFTVTFVGSRLCYSSRELAEYAGKIFESLYNDLFNI